MPLTIVAPIARCRPQIAHRMDRAISDCIEAFPCDLVEIKDNEVPATSDFQSADVAKPVRGSNASSELRYCAFQRDVGPIAHTTS